MIKLLILISLLVIEAKKYRKDFKSWKVIFLRDINKGKIVIIT